ncbi:MAG: serine/threonine-protein kinase, partial [Myxococcota bacterium]
MREALEHQLFGTPPKPVRVGRFVIVDRIGSGGMGTVFGAYDPQLDRRIAIKVLHPQRHSPTEAQRWLSAEARSLARLSHPNVTTVYDVGLADDHLYMAMELVEGGTLARFCQQHDGRGRARTRALVDLMIQACRGLQAAHESGLLHRDLKPGNLLVGDDGRLRIADFGLARTLEPSDTPLDNAQGAPTPPPNPNPNLEATAATQTWAGTPAYMAPEQFRGQATEQSDQFALCVTFFEALCGQRPYPARSVEAQRQRLASGPAEVPPHVTIPTWLMRALLRGLRFEPTERFESIAALRHALERGGRDRRLALIVASGVAATATATLLVGPPPDPCADVHARVQGMWNPTRSEAIARALRAGPEPTPAIVAHQVVEALGRHFEGWGEAAQEICEVRAAAALPPDGLHDDKGDIDPRRACLDRRRGQLEYVRDALERGDPRVVANAEQIVMAVPDPGRCAEIEADEAKVETETLEAARAGLHELAEQLDALKIDLIGGRTGEVVAQGEVLLRQLDERQLYATAAWTGDLVVTAQIGRQDIAAAETAALRSLRAAERAGAPRLRVNAWERLASVHRIFVRFDR